MALIVTLTTSYFIVSKSITTKNSAGHIECGDSIEGPWTAPQSTDETENWSIQLDVVYTDIAILADCTSTNLRSSLRLLNQNEIEIFSEDCMPTNPEGFCRCQAGGYNGLEFNGFINAGIYYFEIKFVGGQDPYDYKYTVTCTGAQTTPPTSIPTVNPTSDPISDPTSDPTVDPTVDPTYDPTSDPTTDPTLDPTKYPTQIPTNDPSMSPFTQQEEPMATETTFDREQNEQETQSKVKHSTITTLIIVGICIASVVCIFCVVLIYKMKKSNLNGNNSKLSIDTCSNRLNSVSTVQTLTTSPTTSKINMTPMIVKEDEEMNEIEAWLREIGLKESAKAYGGLFINGGYESVAIVKKCIEEKQHLIEIGIASPVHQRLLLNEINELKQIEHCVEGGTNVQETGTSVTEGNETQNDIDKSRKVTAGYEMNDKNNPNIALGDMIIGDD